METVRKGACRCEQLRFEVVAEPLITMACHCRGCQRMTASAFSLTALFPAGAFTVTHGEPAIGGLHGPSRHYFCGHCKSWVFTRPASVEGVVAVRTPMFDDTSGLEPFAEAMTSEKMPWATTPAVHSFESFPAPEDFGPLVQAYAAR
jgi:hypothetical protein